MRGPLGRELCWAGREALFSGKWSNIHPCVTVATNLIIGPSGEPTSWFCDIHFQELVDAGAIDNPSVGYLHPRDLGWSDPG